LYQTPKYAIDARNKKLGQTFDGVNPFEAILQFYVVSDSIQLQFTPFVGVQVKH
jgi:hypothetical protein